MINLTPQTAVAWLSANGFPVKGARFRALGGGVSNQVILAEYSNGAAVLKQALGRLRVEHDWCSDRTRVFREAAAMKWLNDALPALGIGGRVPRLLVEDRGDYLIAMESAPSAAEMWKTQLFRGEFETSSARSAGKLLASIIAVSHNNLEAERIFGDQTVFDQLRIDPYYRFTAQRHPETAPYFDALIARSAARRVSLVHGDWSPKNLLVDSEIWAIDWEVVHYGDPSYDVAFLLNHLLLKSIAMPANRSALTTLAVEFLKSLSSNLAADLSWIEQAALEHLPALLLARVEGKSPAEYLDAEMRARTWKLGLDLIVNPARSALDAFTR